MKDSEGPGTRGLVCDQCSSVDIANNTFTSLKATGSDSKGAALNVKNTCGVKVDDQNQFSGLEAHQGPAVFVKNAQADIKGSFSDIKQGY